MASTRTTALPPARIIGQHGLSGAPLSNLQMDAAAIAKALEGRPLGRGRWLVRCPAHNDRNPSLIISDAPNLKDGVSVHCFAGCDWRVVKAKLADLQLLNGNQTSPRESLACALQARPHFDMRKRHLTLWAKARSPAGTLVPIYLASRGLHFPRVLLNGNAIRFHPQCPFKLDNGKTVRLPAMLALMRDVRTDEPRAIHRTALLPDGTGKARMPDGSSPKKMLGHAKGAVVKLIADEDVTLGLGLAEGIETALTPICSGWLPVWACGSSGAIRGFPVLPGIERLTIFADADHNSRGLEDARACARRWQDAGVGCDILLPPDDGADWNDVEGYAQPPRT